MSKCRDKVCPSSQICNPKSGRCVKTSGDIGKKLVAAMGTSPVASAISAGVSLCKKACSPMQICNPASKRCVLKNSRLGKSLSRRVPSRPGIAALFPVADPSSSDAVDLSLITEIKHSYGKDFDEFIQRGHNDVVLVKKISTGAYGTVYIGCESANKYDCKVVKVQKLRAADGKRELVHETEMQGKFADLGLAPKVYRVGFFNSKSKKYAAIEMDKIDGTLQELLKTRQEPETLNFVIIAVMDLLDALCVHGLVHGDLHDGNLGFLAVPGTTPNSIGIKLMVIDFGMACCLKEHTECRPGVDLLQFMRSFGLDMNRYNAEYLYDYFYRVANTELGLNLPSKYSDKAWKMIDDIQQEFYDEYIDGIFRRDVKRFSLRV